MQKRILYFMILFSLLHICHAIGQVVIREELIVRFGADSLDPENRLKKSYWEYWHFTFAQTGKLKITIISSNPDDVDLYFISPAEIDLPEQPGSVWRSQVYSAGTSLTFANKDHIATWEATNYSDGYMVYCYNPGFGVVLTFRVQVIYEGIDHFFVECSPDTIIHSQKTYINAEARDIFDQKVSKYQFVGNLYVDVKIDDHAKQYGKLNYDYLIYPDSPTYEADDLLKNVHYYNVLFDRIYFNADKQVPSEIQNINVTVLRNDDSTVFGTSNFHIMDGFHYFQFSFPQDTLSYPDTITFFIQARDINNEDYPLLLNTSLDFSLDYIGEYIGSFITAAGDKADFLTGVTYEQARNEGVKFTVDRDNVPSLWSAIIRVSETLQPYFNSSGTLFVEPTLVDHFEVIVTPDTIAHSDTAVIVVQAKDKNNKDVELSGTTLLTFALDESGTTYGSFYDAVNNRLAKSFNDILYSSANNGLVKYIADGENPCSFQQFEITVEQSSDVRKAGNSTATIRCKLEFTYYSQGDPAWRDILYDFYKKLSKNGKIILQPEYHYKIREKGCALTCMAMVLKSAGFDYDPLILNEAMNRDGYWGKNDWGNWTGAVIWEAVNYYASPVFKNDIPTFIGTHKHNWIKRIPIQTAFVDNYLKRCDYVIVLVENGNSNHWVLVTDKKDNQYMILDPGNSNNKTLNFYNNTIYRAVIYERICDEN